MRTGRMEQGYGIIQRAVMKLPIDVYSKSVYCLLVSYAGAQDACFPSLNTMCKDLKISKPKLIESIKVLIEWKLIIADRRKTKLGEFTSNIYYPMQIMEVNDDPSGVVNTVNQVVSQGDNVVNQVNPKNNKEEESLFNNKDSDTMKRFKIPGFEEVEEYFKLLKKGPDALKFYNFYKSKGWMVGRNKMKDWQAAAQNFVRDEKKPGKAKSLNGVSDMMSNFEDI